MYALIVTAVSLMVIMLIMGIHFSDLIIHPKTYSFEETYKYEIETGKIKENEFLQADKEEVYIRSPFGYKLFGMYFPVKDSKKAVIICHGLTWTLCGSLKYVRMFLRRGFNVLVCDHRNHGKSGGRNTTFGYYEKYDIKAWTSWLYKRLGPDCRIGTMGESLGAATVLQNAAIDSRLSFCIADCPYSDLAGLFKMHLRKSFHIPSFPFLNIASFFTKLRIGVSFKDISPVRDIDKIKIPVFFIHANDDECIPKEMSIEMYNAKKGFKKLYIAPNARHVESYWKNREQYELLVEEFLEEIGLCF